VNRDDWVRIKAILKAAAVLVPLAWLTGPESPFKHDHIHLPGFTVWVFIAVLFVVLIRHH
jgi:hypothetical protein